MELREVHVICEQSTGTECAERGVCAMLFEAPSLDALGTALTRWTAVHPRLPVPVVQPCG